jgi:hypothetical protein
MLFGLIEAAEFKGLWATMVLSSSVFLGIPGRGTVVGTSASVVEVARSIDVADNSSAADGDSVTSAEDTCASLPNGGAFTLEELG